LNIGFSTFNSQATNAASTAMPIRIYHMAEGAGSEENPYMMQNIMMQKSAEPAKSNFSPLASAHSLFTRVNIIISAGICNNR
jgi:hypothetical protein